MIPEVITIGVSGKRQSGKSSLSHYLSTYIKNQVTVMRTHSHVTTVSPACSVFAFSDPLKRFLTEYLGINYIQVYGSDDDKNSPTKYSWDNLPDHIRVKYSKSGERKSVLVPKEFGGAEYETYFSPDKRTGQMTARECLQVFGTDILRGMIDDNLWINVLFRDIERERKTYAGRSLFFAIISDIRFLSELNSVINCKNSYIIRLTRSIDDKEVHPSETELDNYDWSSLGEKCCVIDNQNKPIEFKNDQATIWLNKLLEKYNVGSTSSKIPPKMSGGCCGSRCRCKNSH